MPSLHLWRPRQQLRRTSLAAVVLAAALAGCGAEPAAPAAPAAGESGPENELLVNGEVTCDQDVSSEEAMGAIERVGGLQQPTWSVTFAESTAAGIIVLVAGDLEDAEPRLFDDYHVAAIVGLSEDQTRAEDFRAVRDAVREVCG